MLISDLSFLRDYWYPVQRTTELGTSPQSVRLFGEEFVAWRTASGAPSLSDPFCPHRSAHLATGWVEGEHLVCPYHGWQFDASGRCRLIPQLEPDVPIPSRAKVKTYPAEDRYGVVWVCVGTPAGGPPIWREAEEGGWRVFVEFFEEWNVPALRIIDNNLDLSHPSYVHRGTFGDPAQATAIPTVESRVDGLVTRLERESRGVGLQIGATDDESRVFRNQSEIELLAPLTSHARFYFPEAPDYSFFGTATPVDDTRSIYMRLTALAGTEAEQPYEQFHAFGSRVTEEDRVILERVKVDFPLDIVSEVHLRTDRATLQYRRHLADLYARSISAVPPQPAAVGEIIGDDAVLISESVSGT